MDITFSLTIKGGHAAFGDTPEDGRDEVVRILQETIRKLENDQTSGVLYDYNGNRVGGFELDAEGDEDSSEDKEDD